MPGIKAMHKGKDNGRGDNPHGEYEPGHIQASVNSCGETNGPASCRLYGDHPGPHRGWGNDLSDVTHMEKVW